MTQTAGQGAWSRFLRWFGLRLLSFAPLLMKTLAFVGTIAMFMVGGGILVHAVHPVQEQVDLLAGMMGAVSVAGNFLQAITPTFASALVGVVAGALLVAVVSFWQFIRNKTAPHAS